jgi:hypothetical protein
MKRRDLQFYTLPHGMEWNRYNRADEPTLGALGLVQGEGSWRTAWARLRHGPWTHVIVYVGNGRVVESWNGHVVSAPLQNWMDAKILWSDHHGLIVPADAARKTVVGTALYLAEVRSPMSPVALAQEVWAKARLGWPGFYEAKTTAELLPVFELS